MSAASQASKPKLGIIAGGGNAPQHLMNACRQMGREFFVLCLEGQADKGLASDVPHIWLHFGEWARLKAAVQEQKIEEIVMIGRVRRPSITELKPDFAGIKVLAKIGLNLLGDDALLRAVGKAIEDDTGVRVIGAQDVFGDLLTPAGQLGKIPYDDAMDDIKHGIKAAQKIGKLDIGQAVIVQQGAVLGTETIDGTNALIERCAKTRREGPGPVLVKVAKPQQDNRYDLPTIGPETINAAAKAGLRGVAVEAGRSLLIDREKTIALADEAGLFVAGITVGQPNG